MWGVVKTFLKVIAGKPASIHEAAMEGDLSSILFFAGKTDNIDIEGCIGHSPKWTPLQFSAWYGKHKIVYELCNLGAIPTKADKNGCTALHLAAMQGHKNTVEALLDCGAQPDVQDKNGMTALHRCSIEGHGHLVTLLVTRGAGINLRDKNGSTPLHLACWKGCMDAACRLLDWGASAVLVDEVGNTALHEAASAGHGDIMEKLLELGVPANSLNERDQTAHDLLILFGGQAVEALALNVPSPLEPRSINNIERLGTNSDSDWEEINEQVDLPSASAGIRVEDSLAPNLFELREVGSGDSGHPRHGEGPIGPGSPTGPQTSASYVHNQSGCAGEPLCDVTIVPMAELEEVCKQGRYFSGMFGKFIRCRYKGRRVTVRQFGQDYRNELSLFVQLNHPSVVKALGVCLNPPNLIVESASITLSDCLFRAHPANLNWRDRVRIMVEVVAGLEYLELASEGEVTHCPITCGNVYVNDRLQVKLLDFGLPAPYMAFSRDEFMTSLGLFFLMLLTGCESDNLLQDVKLSLDRNALHPMLDSHAGSWPIIESIMIARLGIKCVNGSGSLHLKPHVLDPLLRISQSLGLMPQTSKPRSRTINAKKRSKGTKDVPAMFICPITHEILEDPVVAADGHTYERSAIQTWVSKGHSTSPMTNMVFEHGYLTANQLLKSAISEWKIEHGE